MREGLAGRETFALWYAAAFAWLVWRSSYGVSRDPGYRAVTYCLGSADERVQDRLSGLKGLDSNAPWNKRCSNQNSVRGYEYLSL